MFVCEGEREQQGGNEGLYLTHATDYIKKQEGEVGGEHPVTGKSAVGNPHRETAEDASFTLAEIFLLSPRG